MNRVEIYQKMLKKQHLQADFEQEKVLEKLADIANKLATLQNPKWWTFTKKNTVRGLYIWGDVGRGKTLLLDLFYRTLDIRQKRRQHFSHFMQSVHSAIRNYQGEKNPLKQVAKDISSEVKVICFDEFFVEDIADAMILGNLFTKLFALGVTLVATSNIPPDQLYLSGLQRSFFLPAIETLKRHVEVVHLDQGIDYRGQPHQKMKHYFFPLDSGNQALEHHFKKNTSAFALFNSTIILEDRLVKVAGVDETCIWFDFFALCGHARGVNDYIALAEKFESIFISNLPILSSDYDNEARRFIALVDELYDRRKPLFISAEVHFNALYQGARLAFPFKRTVSRLKEMQSAAYGAEQKR